jgi:hypothetical protein
MVDKSREWAKAIVWINWENSCRSWWNWIWRISNWRNRIWRIYDWRNWIWRISNCTKWRIWGWSITTKCIWTTIWVSLAWIIIPPSTLASILILIVSLWATFWLTFTTTVSPIKVLIRWTFLNWGTSTSTLCFWVNHWPIALTRSSTLAWTSSQIIICHSKIRTIHSIWTILGEWITDSNWTTTRITKTINFYRIITTTI